MTLDPAGVVPLPQGAGEICRETGMIACRIVVRAGPIRTGGWGETGLRVTAAVPDVSGRMREAVCARVIRVGRRLVRAAGRGVVGM
jgi:hypothetical protein